MNERSLTKFILSYLIEKEDYLTFTEEEQQLVFQSCRTIMKAIYHAVRYQNVIPVVLCGDYEAKELINRALRVIQEPLPSTKRIKVVLVQ
jgi:myosin-crossreactive antigen